MDVTRRKGLHRVEIVGTWSGERRHVREIPALRIPRADPVENDPLNLTDPTRAIKPVMVGKVGYCERRIALQMRTVTRGAVLCVSRWPARHREFHQFGIARDAVRGDHKKPRA